MSDPPQAPGDSRLLAEVRDALARAFAEAVSARVPQVLGLLEQQLALTQDQAQWKRLRGAIDLLKGLRADLAARLAKEVTNRFDAKLKPDDPVFGKTARFSRDSLSLVADDQIQEEIALGNASKRLKDAAGDELFALTQRLAVVMGRDTLPDDRNPAFPRILARALLETFATSGGDRTARIAAFAAFEPALLDVVGRVYESVNRLMRERGILPDFKRSYGAPVQAPTRAS
ncbi:MAG TPA: DUF1631 family protein, partial [Usitatibacter sp.]|nr:DUF1631 family protein [Usitatibacter sp.]